MSAQKLRPDEILLIKIFSKTFTIIVFFIVFTNLSLFSAPQDIGNGFLDHGIAIPASMSRGTVATQDANNQNVVLAWLRDYRGCYSIIMINANTGVTQQTATPVVGDDPYASVLSSSNKFYTHFNSCFMEFDPESGGGTFTFSQFTSNTRGWDSEKAMSMTEDNNGIIWSATFPDCGLVSFNPSTRQLTDYGSIHSENWMQYPFYIATDDAGWVYLGLGYTESQIIAFNPATSTSYEMIPTQDLVSGYAYVCRYDDGKVYGHIPDGGWYRFYNGVSTYLGTLPTGIAPAFNYIIAGGSSLFFPDFPNGKKLQSLDLDDRTIKVENLGQVETIEFDYTTQGAYIMGLAAAPNNTICGGTAFPERFFSYNPKKDLTDEWINRTAYGQWNTVTSQGDSFFVGSYTKGSLLEWDTTKEWVPTAVGSSSSNPKYLIQCLNAINRPYDLLAYPDGKTIIMSGAPNYGCTGGGLLFWDRDTKSGTILEHTDVLPYHSTMSLVALPNNKLLGGTTVSTAGSGGEQIATEAKLYIMNITTKAIEHEQVIVTGGENCRDMIAGPGTYIFGFVDRKHFFVFDYWTRSIIHTEDVEAEFGLTVSHQGSRIFVKGPNGQIYILFNEGIALLNTSNPFEITMLAELPSGITISAGGDILDGRIYFTANGGSNIYSYQVDFVGDWKLNQTTGTSAIDSSPYKNDGTLTNMTSPACWVTGKIDNALQFDGVNDCVNCGNDSILNPSSAITVEAWVNMNDKTSFQEIVSRGAAFAVPTSHGPYSMGIYNNKIYWDTGDGTTRSSFSIDISNLSLNTWYHFVGTFDGTDQNFYINGVKYAHQANIAFMRTDTNNTFIGGWLNKFNGKIDEVKIYNRVLSDDDIYTHYLKADTIGSWKLDQSTGTSAIDSSLYKNDGTLTNMTSPACWVTGKIDNALQFDGVNDCVNCGNDSILNPSSAITVEAWVNMNDKTSFQEIVSRGAAFAVPASHGPYSMGIYNNKIYWDTGDGTTRSSFSIDISNLSLNTWYHFVGTFDGTNQNFYINGVKYAHQANIAFMRTDTNNTFIGGWLNKFNGKIDEVKIYNRVLSDDELLYNYSLGNQAPIVYAGVDQEILANETITLNATITDDGHPVSGTTTVSWSKISGPGNVTFGNANAEDTTANFSATGAYVLRLVASDGNKQGYDDVTVYCGVPSADWQLNDGTGDAAADSSPYCNDGELVNMNTTTCWVTGATGGALQLDGVNDYVYCGTDASLQMGTGAITVEHWVKPNAWSDYKALFCGGAIGGYHGYGTGLHSGGSLFWYEVYGSTGGRQVYSADIGIQVGQWNHIVAIFDGINNVMKVYRNGVEKHSVNISDPGDVQNTKDFTIGSYYGKWFFDGTIDEVRVYRRALSASEIYQRYQAGL